MAWNLTEAVKTALAAFSDTDPRFYPGPRSELSLVLAADLWDRASQGEKHVGEFQKQYKIWAEMPSDVTLESVIDEWHRQWGFRLDRPSAKQHKEFVNRMFRAREAYYREPCHCGCQERQARHMALVEGRK